MIVLVNFFKKFIYNIMSTQFWINDPTILLNKDYIFELWPSSDMYYEQKLNSITRLVILISILGYILTMSIKIIFFTSY
jgi:hypothetical protein